MAYLFLASVTLCFVICLLKGKRKFNSREVDQNDGDIWVIHK